jgi:uncharacterized phiE125 gp8 family phage protein
METQLVLSTAPTKEPVSLLEMRQHLRVDDDDSDDYIRAITAAARQVVESYCKVSVMPTVWQYKLEYFPPRIILPVGPLLSTTGFQIDYVDSAGATQTLDSAEYQVSQGKTGQVVPAYGKTWPSTRPQLDAVTVTFTAGWPDDENVPPAIKQATKLICGTLYENREDVIVGVMVSQLPTTIRNLLLPLVRNA